MYKVVARLKGTRWLGKVLPLFFVVLLAVFTYVGYLVVEKEVTVVIDGTSIEFKTLKSDVASVLAENNLQLYPKDTITPALDEKLKDGLTIEITRAFNITLLADGEEKSILTTPKAVEKILEEAQLVLGEKDIVEPALSVVADKTTSTIQVKRVKEELVSQKETVAYRTEQKEDATLERGIRRVLQQGKTGEKETTIKITYEDGQKIKEEVVETKITKQPINQIISLGAMKYASRGGRQFEFSRTLDARATAYTHTGSRTSTGTKPKVGTVAVDPKTIPLGSRLYVEGYGFGRAEDVGGAIKGNAIDVFLESESECRRWGRRTVKVYVLQ